MKNYLICIIDIEQRRWYYTRTTDDGVVQVRPFYTSAKRMTYAEARAANDDVRAYKKTEQALVDTHFITTYEHEENRHAELEKIVTNNSGQ